jgi:hypothetical protein
MAPLSPSGRATGFTDTSGSHAARCDDPLGDAVVFLIAPLLCVAYYAAIAVLRIVSRED